MRSLRPSSTAGVPGIVTPATEPVRRDDARQIPEDRRGEIEVRIVGEDRLAGCRACAGNRPFVRRAVGERRPAAELLVSVERGVIGMRLRRRRDRRVQGQIRKDPGGLLDAEFRGDAGAQQFDLVIVAELQAEQLADHHRIRRSPRPRRIADQKELRRQAALVRAKPIVDAVGIGLEPRLRIGRQGREARFRRGGGSRGCG